MSLGPVRSMLVVAAMTVVAAACASDAGEQAQPTATPSPTSSTSETTESPDSTVESTDETAASTSTAVATTSTEASAPPADACVTGVDPGIGLKSGALESGGLEYRYQWTVPSTAADTPLPVVLDFHGIGSNGAQQAAVSGFHTLAETEGFVAVQPTGRSTELDPRASWELPQFDTAERDDVRFVLDLLDRVAADVCIDRNRVYATGLSNGGFFTSVLVCELSELVAAAASVAGVTHPDGCAPERPVPYLAFHGTDDTVVPYDGGGESTLSGGVTSPFFEQVMPDEFAEFAADFGCAEPVDTEVTAEIELRRWTACDGGVELGFYTISGGGHTWPGSAATNLITALGVTTMDLDATAVAWEFFEQYSLDTDTTTNADADTTDTDG